MSGPYGPLSNTPVGSARTISASPGSQNMNSPVAVKSSDLSSHAVTLADNNPASKRLPSTLELKMRLPLNATLTEQVAAHRRAVRAILNGEDSRLLVIVGPCSIHDPQSALEYAERLASLAAEVSDQMLLVMRAYVEKPRTTVGWKGLAYDPDLDGSDDMAGGLTLSRQLMRDMLGMGLPIATEILQPMAAGYFDDLLSWVAIGARTTESQIHREMASGLPMAVGFKNGTDGGVAVASDAMRSAAHPHRHFGMDAHGHPAIIDTQGNPDTHIVLRGGHSGPNYDRQSVAQVQAGLSKNAIASRIMVDCSHANSGKDPARQPHVFNDVLEQRLSGNPSLIGMMIESHLYDGCQALGETLQYGVSVTDGCLGWTATEQLLREAVDRLRYR
ncbi:Phospho-2-dehydro-3-deoxyheptonate aldolase [Pseudomonas syringae pv. tomato]|nr:Phospho-2-dehydro-3-deoxyheptonate aldolase [Pseudomonas syringae pv. tomato]